MVIIKTTLGDIKLELDHENTPVTTQNFLEYAKNGFYEGTIFHRVINGFMIQGGGLTSDMENKKTGKPIVNEADKGQGNDRGTIAMARTNQPDSATAQFFINVVDNGFLNHKNKTPSGWGYCVFGKVVEGMDVVDKIKSVKTNHSHGHDDVPVEAIMIEKVVILADVTA